MNKGRERKILVVGQQTLCVFYGLISSLLLNCSKKGHCIMFGGVESIGGREMLMPQYLEYNFCPWAITKLKYLFHILGA